jgi:hypothetical protein
MENSQMPMLPPRRSSLAIASLVAAFAFAPPLAILFGHMAMARIKKYPDSLTGIGLARAGTILGYVGLVLWIFIPAILLSELRWLLRKTPYRSICIMNIRNVQQAVRGHQSMTSLKEGDPIDWNVIFGPDGYLDQPVCPLGDTYTFVDKIPPTGTLVGSCSHADHVPKDHSTW